MVSNPESPEEHYQDALQDDPMDFEIEEVLDDGETVGIGQAEPGPETVQYDDAWREFVGVADKWSHSGEYVVGDEHSALFVSSDGGQLSVTYGPTFAPIETAISVWQWELVKQQLQGHSVRFDLMFDDSGLVAFQGEETTVVVAPKVYEWDSPSEPCGPRTPGGPNA